MRLSDEEFAKLVYNAAKKVSDINPIFVTAQAALESGWGKSAIGNNLFGITKGSSWTGATRLVLTTEYFKTADVKFKQPEKVVSVTYVRDNCYKYKVYRLFRDYPSIEDCLKDHLQILQKPHFADAWAYRHDPVEFVKRLVDNVGLKYATATNYVEIMISMFKSVERLLNK